MIHQFWTIDGRLLIVPDRKRGETRQEQAARDWQIERDAAACEARLRDGEVNNETMYGNKRFYGR